MLCFVSFAVIVVLVVRKLALECILPRFVKVGLILNVEYDIIEYLTLFFLLILVFFVSKFNQVCYSALKHLLNGILWRTVFFFFFKRIALGSVHVLNSTFAWAQGEGTAMFESRVLIYLLFFLLTAQFLKQLDLCWLKRYVLCSFS